MSKQLSVILKTPFITHFFKILTTTALLAFGTVQVKAQVDTIVIIFAPSATPAHIGKIAASMNAIQIGMTFPSEARLWQVECSTGKPCHYDGNNYIDVNEVIKKVSSETKTESIGKNYTTTLPPYVSVPIQDPGPFTVKELTDCNAAPIVTNKGTLSEEITIALIDSGVDKDHSFFKHASYFTSTSRTFTGANCFDDKNGHGTHIAGIIRIMDILGGSANSFKIMNLQTQEPDGSGKVWNAIRAVDWANVHGAAIINMSLGYMHDPLVDSLDGKQPLEVAIDKANFMNNVLVVASAGNDAMNLDTVKHYPSAFPSQNLISVASDSCSTYFSNWFSNYGMTMVDLAAPGENILGPNLYGMTPKWTRKTGTSMSAGIITGAAGLLATHLAPISDGRLKCAILAGADFRGYPVQTEGTLHTPHAKDSLLYGGCAYAPKIGPG